VDANSGYRYYDAAQLKDARLIAMLRQLDFPLAAVKELVASDPSEAAGRIALRWREVETEHDARRDLANYLINQLNGRKPDMYEVNTRDIPERSLLCLKRHVDEQGAWALGKEFIAILRERPLPKMEGREGAMFSIYWGEVSADSDGPVEWCKPVPTVEAETLALQYPELSLRTERAHQEAYVALPNDAIPAGPGGNPAVQWQLASESLQAWAGERGMIEGNLDATPEDLGVRITYLSSGSVAEASAPYCDFAVPFALANA
jgi:DNA-binding transcriptional MerR regulator